MPASYDLRPRCPPFRSRSLHEAERCAATSALAKGRRQPRALQSGSGWPWPILVIRSDVVVAWRDLPASKGSVGPALCGRARRSPRRSAEVGQACSTGLGQAWSRRRRRGRVWSGRAASMPGGGGCRCCRGRHLGAGRKSRWFGGRAPKGERLLCASEGAEPETAQAGASGARSGQRCFSGARTPGVPSAVAGCFPAEPALVWPTWGPDVFRSEMGRCTGRGSALLWAQAGSVDFYSVAALAQAT